MVGGVPMVAPMVKAGGEGKRGKKRGRVKEGGTFRVLGRQRGTSATQWKIVMGTKGMTRGVGVMRATTRGTGLTMGGRKGGEEGVERGGGHGE